MGPGRKVKIEKCVRDSKKLSCKEGGKMLPVDLDSNFFRSLKDKDEAALGLHFILEVIIHFSAQWKAIAKQMKLFFLILFYNLL